MCDISAKGPEFGYRSGHQVGVEPGAAVAAAAHGRANPDDVGVDAAQLARS